ncbi:MAG: LiaI-LiaF-like domain-containing protein, partial [Bacteroidota bacterium]
MKAKYLIGLGFIILGVFLLLDQMGVVPFGMIIGDLWPSIIILIGVYLIS